MITGVPTCKLCLGSSCSTANNKESYVECHKCARNFKNDNCLKNHVKNGVCDEYFKCKTCDKIVSVKQLQKFKREHECSMVFCTRCQDYFSVGHQCCVQREPHEKVTAKYIYFDFECTQETGVHVPNYCVAQKCCVDCCEDPLENECVRCGQQRQVVFKGPTTAQDFCKWLLEDKSNSDSIAVAHNMKGYDGMFILDYLYKNCIIPSMILAGGKIMSMDIPFNSIKVIDSLNFLPMPLSSMPKTFGIDELKKGFFPHFFNTTENQSYCGPLPSKDFYDPSSMSTEKRAEFMTWYESEKSKDLDFNMANEIHAYCVSDVDILRRCCMRFQKMFIKITNGVDPFQKCITIASACHYVYRRNFLAEDSIAVLPPRGYDQNYNHSKSAIQWLTHIGEKDNVHIRHAENGGEVTVGRYRVDGFCEANKTVYEFYGCYYHGCQKCYQFNTENKHGEKTMGELFLDTLAREAYILKVLPDFEVVSMWECEWKEMKKQKLIPPCILSYDTPPPLNPREAFTGGRTNATRLLYDCKANEKIKYVDFTSLYPWVNKYGIYPVGHPQVIVSNFKDVSEYFGLIRCTVLPPQNLFHPVLPTKINNKLMFVLCRKCAEDGNQQPCHHDDDDRSLYGTWVSLELNEAIKKGYRVISIDSVWHFPRKTQYSKEAGIKSLENYGVIENKEERGLFRHYVDTFLKLKQEASGWPDWCKTESDKDRYVREYLENEGIKLDRGNIEKNKGLRALAKLKLNGFWGRWGMRNNLTHIQITDNPAELYEYLTDDEKEVIDLNFVTDEMVEMRWTKKEEFETANKHTNVVIAAFTTAQARLKLFGILDRLGQKVGYYDTDSIIYIERDGEWSPPLGDYLGELTDELDGRYIQTFVAGGPKSYAYKMNDNKTVCKIRGITLNYKNSKLLNFDVMKQMVKNLGTKDLYKVTVSDPHHITRDIKRQRILSKPMEKNYKIVYDKRVIGKDLITYPYGWVE